MIRTLEELAMNAWPSLQAMLYDGWVLRFAGGYTKRANSVHPLYSGSVNVEEKIQVCEQAYQGKKLDVVFKMTAAAQPENLDRVLEAKGYKADSDTSVQILELDNANESPAQSALMTEELSEEWLSAFCRLSQVCHERELVLRQILYNLVPAKCFASIRYQEQVVACGLGVAQGQFIGLFDIVTDVNSRGRGFGRRLLLNILAWGKSKGAQTAYLQVMLNNGPALHLYSKLGFREIYKYWYRIKPNL